MEFIRDLLVEDGRMDMDHLELPPQPVSQQEAGKGIAQPLDFSQARHEDQHGALVAVIPVEIGYLVENE